MAEWIPLFQTLVWLFFVGALVIYFRGTCSSILQAIAQRIEKGASFKAGPGGVELGGISKEEMENLPSVPQKAPKPMMAPKPTDWFHKREEEYRRVEGYMLVHVYRPSTVPGQKYDIFLFVVRHVKGTAGPPRRQFDEIERAEFFFGESWGNQVFSVQNTGDVIGVQTHAWGTFLATCRITFKESNPDGKKEPIVLFRYVDFHMLQAPQLTPKEPTVVPEPTPKDPELAFSKREEGLKEAF